MSQAGFLDTSGGGGGNIQTLTGNSGGIIPPTGNNINIVGTAGQVDVVGNPATSTLTISLTGGGTAIDSLTLQAGTTPCVPSAGGLITLSGAVVASGSTPIQTNGTAVNTATIQVQTSQAISSTDATKIGLCAFSSTYFAVDANGFVTSSLSEVVNYTVVTNAASPYTVLSTDYYISCDVTAGAITIRLPNTPSTARTFVIKDKIGNSSVNNITVTTVGGAVLIDGAATFTMNTNYSSINLLFDGTAYQIW